jgi:hypothetical protein
MKWHIGTTPKRALHAVIATANNVATANFKPNEGPAGRWKHVAAWTEPADVVAWAELRRNPERLPWVSGRQSPPTANAGPEIYAIWFYSTEHRKMLFALTLYLDNSWMITKAVGSIDLIAAWMQIKIPGEVIDAQYQRAKEEAHVE